MKGKLRIHTFVAQDHQESIWISQKSKLFVNFSATRKLLECLSGCKPLKSCTQTFLIQHQWLLPTACHLIVKCIVGHHVQVFRQDLVEPWSSANTSTAVIGNFLCEMHILYSTSAISQQAHKAARHDSDICSLCVLVHMWHSDILDGAGCATNGCSYYLIECHYLTQEHSIASSESICQAIPCDRNTLSDYEIVVIREMGGVCVFFGSSSSHGCV